MSAYNFVIARTKGAKGFMAKGTRNEFKLRGFLLSIYKKTSKGDASGTAAAAPAPAPGAGARQRVAGPKFSVKVRLGSFQGDPEAVDGEHGSKVRKFEIGVGQNVPADRIPVGADGKQIKTRIVEPYTDVAFDIDEKNLTGLGAYQPLDVVELHGIVFNYWYPKDAKPESVVMLFCNVDQMTLVPGAHRGAYAYNLWLAAGFPERRVDVDNATEATDGDDDPHGGVAPPPPAPSAGAAAGAAAPAARFAVKLGKTTFCLPVFGSDKAAEEAHQARASGALYFPAFDEETDQETNQPIVTFLPAIWDGKTAIPHLGLKSHARGAQWFAGSFAAAAAAREAGDADALFMPQAFFTLKEDSIGIFETSSQSEWKTAGSYFLRACKYAIFGSENLERTRNDQYNQDAAEELHAEQGVDFKLALAVKGLACNFAEEIERLGFRIPADRVAAFLPEAKPQVAAGGAESDLMLESPLHAGNYHALAQRGTVICLNEWKGNLSLLVREGLYDFYVTSDLSTKTGKDQAAAKQLDAFPAEARYLFFYPEFAAALEGNETDPDAIKAIVAKFGLPEKTNPIRLALLAPQVSFKRIYAVLKPERRLHDYVKNERFSEAVKALLPNGPAFLAQLEASLLARAAPAPSIAPAPAPSTAAAPKPSEPEKDVGGGVKRARPAASPEIEAETKAAEKPAKRARKGKAQEPSEDGPESSLMSSDDSALEDTKTTKRGKKGSEAKGKKRKLAADGDDS
jgi:hypothetical protein